MDDFSDTRPSGRAAADGCKQQGRKGEVPVIAFRLFLVLLLVSIVVPASGWAYERWQQLSARDQAGEAYATWAGFYQTCQEVKSTVGTQGVCAQAESASERAQRFTQLEDARAERANLFLIVGLLAPTLLVASFYAGRWILTGKLRPLWLLAPPGSSDIEMNGAEVGGGQRKR